ncbi:MAG: family 78 glycoside hydrolase catalytic domain, partial [Candidatus Ornithomonoglobus sp.]
WEMNKAACRGPVTAALCIEAEADGKIFELEADENFKTYPSPITFDDLRMGCRYDARFEIDNWCGRLFDDSSWDFVKKETAPRGEARLCKADPITVTKTILPIDVKRYDSLPFAYETNAPDSKPIDGCVRDNVYVFDFGVNAAGVTKLKINGKRGQKIVVRHGEYNCGNKFSVNSIGFFRDKETIMHYTDYNQVDVYICKGGEEEFIPKFKYDGFRYAYVEGLEPEQLREDTLTYLVMNADIRSRAEFECSDDVLNKLQECTRRSDLANFYYFPTDCPHREKNGWTGDASMSAEHMLLNLTVEKNLKEWLFSIRKAQNTDGALPGIVPTGGWGFEWGNGPAWDSVCVNLPYYIYKYTGDTSVIEENVSLIMRYLCYIASRCDERGLITVGLGDWVDPFEAENGHIASPLELTDSVTIYDMAKKAEYLFKKIGRNNESEYAARLAKELRSAIREHLIDKNTMTAAGDCQTSQAFMLEAGIFNNDEREKAQRRLVDIIHRDGDINACGMIGLRHIFHALTSAGESELAYKIITGKSRTCYGYWIENGATALWEDFRDKDARCPDSKNHHFLGDISSWFIQEIAGLKPNPNVDDIRYFEISPHFIDELDYVKASYESPFGRVSVMWQRNEHNIKLDISMPEGTYGKAVLPKGYCFENSDNSVDLSGDRFNFTVKDDSAK